MRRVSRKVLLTASPMFLAIFESVMLANGLSAPQHSTYFVIFDDGLLRDGMPPGVAAKRICIRVKMGTFSVFFFSCPSSPFLLASSSSSSAHPFQHSAPLSTLIHTSSTRRPHMNTIAVRYGHFPYIRECARRSSALGERHQTLHGQLTAALLLGPQRRLDRQRQRRLVANGRLVVVLVLLGYRRR